MITKGKKSFAKRIVAMLMTLLMVWSLVPANAYVTWAAEGTYTFTVSYTDTETSEMSYITDATITIYSSAGVAEENKLTAVTGEAGVIGDNGVYEITAEGLESGCKYTVEAAGYKTVTGDLTEDTAVAVPLTKETSETPEAIEVTVSGVVKDAALAEDDSIVTLSGVEVVISTDDAEDVTVISGEDGSYSFTVVAGTEYAITVNYEGYKTYSLTYTAAETDETKDIVLNKKTSIDFEFVNAQMELVVGKTATEVNEFTDSTITDSYTVKYTSSDVNIATVDEQTGIVTAVAVGTVTITATIEEGADNLVSTATYELSVLDKTESQLVFENGTVDGSIVNAVWNETFVSIVAKHENVENAAIVYSSSDESIATIDSATGEVTIVKPGTTTITASFTGNEDYKEASITYVLTVEKAEQSSFALDYEFNGVMAEDGKTPMIEKPFIDGTVTVGVTGETGDVSFESSETAIATVDENGVVTFVTAGTVTITVTAAGDDHYNAATLTYVIKILKAEQNIAFDKTELTIINGQTDYTLPAISNTGANGLTTDIRYSIKEGSDEGVVEVDATTGTLSFTLGTGIVTIVATKAEDDTYASAIAEYTLTVEEWDPLSTGNAENYYTITGTMNNGWYVHNDSDVLDIALSAQDGYTVSAELSTDSSKWTSTVACPQFEDGKENSFSFYIKDTTMGYVSKEYTVEKLQVDTTAPEAAINEVGTTTIWEAILIFFGFMEEEKPTFEIVASDVTSDVAESYYYIAEGLDVVTDTTVLEGYGWIPYAEGDTIVIEKEGENVLYAKVVDNAGNVQYVSSKGLIFDGTAPTVDLTILSTPVQVGETNYYTDDVVIQVVAGDASPYSGIQSITYKVFCNGSETPTQEGSLYKYIHENTNTKNELVASWDSNAENNQNITVSALDNNSKDVVVEVTVTDNSGNITTEEISLNICKETPSISVTYENDVEPNGVNNSIEYFQNFRTAKVVITSRDDIFVKNNVSLVITAVDAQGNPVTGTHSIKWEEDAGDNTHVAYITFNSSAKYNFTVDYTDALETKAEQHVSGVFVIDDEAPTATINSGEPLWQIVLETITLGIWSGNSVEITADWSDEISEIKSIEYYVHHIDFTAENPKVALSMDELDAVAWIAYAPFTASEDATFVYYLKVTDWAGNYTYVSSNGFIIDNTDSAITITPEASQFESGYYTSDVEVLIDVNDLMEYVDEDEKTIKTFSGIKKVTYWVEYLDKETNQMVTQVEETILYEYKDGDALKSQLQETITVEAEDSDEIVIHVTAIDNAGHSIEELNDDIKISLEVPTIKVTYEDGVESTGEIDGVKCYTTTRKAKVVITSNHNLFSKDNAIFTVNGEVVKADETDKIAVVEWVASEDENQHIAYVTFTENAIYDFEVEFSNILGVAATSYPESFIIDNIAPTGMLYIGEDPWSLDNIAETLTLGLWKNKDLIVRAEATDAHSTVKSIEYIMLTGEDALKKLTDADLEAAEWQEFKAFTVSKDVTFNIYLKITDCAGNFTYLNSNGYTVDKTGSNITLKATTEPNKNGYYNGDIEVAINVEEFWGDMESYSGIDTVKYWVTKDGIISQSETTLMDYTIDNPATFDDLVTVFEDKITIVAADNNSDNVVLHVEVTDNAGNVKPAELPVKIDITKPTISLSYNNNTETSLIGEVGIFNKGRVATIVITERTTGFDLARAEESIKIVAKDKDGNILENVTADISNWTTVETEGDPDLAKHTATVTFAEDAYYELEVAYIDNAGNANETVDTGTSKYPYAFTIDQTGAEISLIPEVVKDIYTGDVKLVLKVNDATTTAGINSVKYWITNRNIETDANEKFYVYSSTIDQNFNKEIVVNAANNNSCTVLVKVEAIDNAGNVTVKELPLDIDIDAPTIDVSFDNNSPKNEVDKKGYYDGSRVATIVVKERQEHFNEQDMLTILRNGITELDANNEKVTGSYTIETVSSENGVHTFKVTFQGDANYTFNLSYKDAAGLECKSENVVYAEGTKTPNSFAIDTKNPTAQIQVGEWEPWEELLNTITFGLWSPSAVDIVITADDATSPLASIQYYKTSTFTAMTETELAALSADKWVDYEKFSVGADDIFVVYVKVVDYTGHVTYIGSNGIIVDKTKPVFEQLAPEVTITPQQPINGIYNGDVKVDVSVVDPKDSKTNAYAGLREIKYEIQNMGKTTQEGTLYKFDKTDPTQNELLASWSTSNSSSIGYGKDIVVDADLNNSNDVVIKVIATDNAGNPTESTVPIKIDTTRPTIDISYDNNDGDTTFADGIFFDANRVATITITERNFDASKVNIKITNSDDVVPTVSNWKTTTASGNGDNTTHTATITYSADGDYTFDITYSDNAGNASEAVNYGNALAPTEFTIDKTLPVISVEYDNNEVLNGNYYKADRLGTITITEHNFDASRVTVTLTATDDGQTITAPVISNWRSSGDTHTATISYSTDALYTFDIAYIDKAGNAADDFAQQSFYVDKTAPVVSITGIVDQSANNANEIGFVITATDTNFDVFEPVLSAVVKTDNGFTTQELEIGSVSTINNGKRYTVNNIDTDGIYRITCTVVDKAGNAYTEVTLEDASGNDYVEALTSSDTLVNFSVNRDGSAFEVDENTSKIVKNFYVYEVTEDVVIVEVNTDALASYEVTLNGTALVEGTDYTVITEGGNGAWMKYSYVLNSSLFMAEGEYTIVVSSTDKAENNAFSDVKDTKVSFVVDRTAPVVTITGMQDGGRYQADVAQTVTLIPTDDGGALSSILVRIIDENGEVVKVLMDLTGDALTDALTAGNGAITFEIETDNNGSQIIEVICSDSTLDAEGKANVFSSKYEVVVASSELALVWADTTLRYTIIGVSVAVLVLLIGAIVFFVRRKSEKDKTIVR